MDVKEMYAQILKEKLEQGLDKLQSVDITSKKYKELVININGAINIIAQVEADKLEQAARAAEEMRLAQLAETSARTE